MTGAVGHNPRMNILVIEDNPDLAANVCDFLEAKGHITDAAGDGITGLHLAVTHDYDAIVLDVFLPGMDGFTVCQKLREEAGKSTPVLMLTARDSLEDRVAGLEFGADDYAIKPFALRELEARLKALVRRAHGVAAPKVIRVADLEFDPAMMRVQRGGRLIELPPIALRVLETLMRASPRVVKRDELERAVWGDAPPDSDALRTHIHAVRAAIEPPGELALLHTLRGIGYRLAPPDALHP